MIGCLPSALRGGCSSHWSAAPSSSAGSCTSPLARMNSKFLWSWGPAVVWTAITFVVSHQPVVVIPFGAPDYAAHAINYAVLGVLLIWARAGGDWSAMTIPLIASAVVLTVLLGIADEFHQSFIPGRDASLHDVLADAAGAVAGACVIAVVLALRRQQMRPT